MKLLAILGSLDCGWERETSFGLGEGFSAVSGLLQGQPSLEKSESEEVRVLRHCHAKI